MTANDNERGREMKEIWNTARRRNGDRKAGAGVGEKREKKLTCLEFHCGFHIFY